MRNSLHICDFSHLTRPLTSTDTKLRQTLLFVLTFKGYPCQWQISYSVGNLTFLTVICKCVFDVTLMFVKTRDERPMPVPGYQDHFTELQKRNAHNLHLNCE